MKIPFLFDSLLLRNIVTIVLFNIFPNLIKQLHKKIKKLKRLPITLVNLSTTRLRSIMKLKSVTSAEAAMRVVKLRLACVFRRCTDLQNKCINFEQIKLL